jgi:hypothetical protein
MMTHATPSTPIALTPVRPRHSTHFATKKSIPAGTQQMPNVAKFKNRTNAKRHVAATPHPDGAAGQDWGRREPGRNRIAAAAGRTLQKIAILGTTPHFDGTPAFSKWRRLQLPHGVSAAPAHEVSPFDIFTRHKATIKITN